MLAECYYEGAGLIVRRLRIGKRVLESSIQDVSSLPPEAPAWSKWWRSYLKGAESQTPGFTGRRITIVDLFCGCGGFALGVKEAARALGLKPVFLLAVDIDSDALATYAHNLRPRATLRADVHRLAEFQCVGWGGSTRFARPPEVLDRSLASLVGRPDLVIAAPPCQGHSNLNNHTRRTDPRNLLYLDAVAVAVALEAGAILVENVPDVANDRMGILETAKSLLKTSGYQVVEGILSAEEVGLPQVRRRRFLAASRGPLTEFHVLRKAFHRKPEGVWWAIEDLLDARSDDVLDSSPKLSAENKKRVDYLFELGLYELPPQMRPPCHRNGHTYPSVYGRLRWEEPAGTITGGFMSPGQGRFIHPLQRRTLTPREAARLQGFPDSFRFRVPAAMPPTRRSLAKLIGDAVPPLLGYVAAFSVLAGLVDAQEGADGRCP
ncbi:MAG: putative BsuMI modification methylase subunit YdiO [Candidatus Binatia bacterium]|nr:MAG: putative BsuMI modification methylase subunit YdiO [Candidatus Binatia bacterium]